jgi:hypothetical protein
VTAPASFATVFTDGTPKETVLAHIAQELAQLPENPAPEAIVAHLNTLKEVYRATFAIKSGKLVLIADENDLAPGEEIWRKLPGLTVPNRYHAESEYLKEFADAGFHIQNLHRPQFSSPTELEAHNSSHPQSLGEEYIAHHPFAIYCLIKEKP